MRIERIGSYSVTAHPARQCLDECYCEHDGAAARLGLTPVTNDFVSPTNIARLTAVWDDEYRQFRRWDLADRDYVYVWVDGIHFNIRLEDDRLCTLVMIGARPDGTKGSWRSTTATARAPRAGRWCCET